MSLFSFFRKNKQETVAADSAFYSRAETDPQIVRPRKRKAVTRTPADGSVNTPVDPVLPEKKRARRRLVGAVALVMAVIIGLPMVLDPEPKALPDDLTIEIPSKERPVSAPVQTIPPAPGKAGLPAHPVAPAHSALDLKEEMVAMPPGTLDAASTGNASFTEGKPAGRPEAAVGAPARSPAERAVAKAAPGLADKTVIKSMDKSAEKAVLRNSVEQPFEAKSAAKSDAHSDSRPAARLGAQSRLQSKSETWAEQKFSKGESRPETRPDSRSDAVTDGKSESGGAKPAKFSVQVAALASSDKVSELRGKLKDAGIASYTQKVATGSGERIRIRIGPLSSRQDVDKLRARLATLGLNGTVIPSPL